MHKRAGLVGVKEFGNIKHDFTYDNTDKAASGQASESKSSKFKSRTKKYSDIICTPFNREAGCRLPCSFLHACMFCETRGQAKRDCTLYKKSKDSKQEISFSHKEGGKSSGAQSVSDCYVPSWCVGSAHKAEKPQSLCINENRGESNCSYTQEDVKKTRKSQCKIKLSWYPA